MKKLTAIIMGSLFVAVIAFTFNTVALAAPPGHGGGHHFGHHGGHHGHHGHHRPHWGYGSGVYVSSAPVVTDDCYMVKKCYINEFGHRRCRWVQVCD
jgi:hypothetical protein